MKLLNWKSNKGDMELSDYGNVMIRTWELFSDFATIQFTDLINPRCLL